MKGDHPGQHPVGTGMSGWNERGESLGLGLFFANWAVSGTMPV